ncbi:MAG: RNA polymerase sigma-70 factor [Bacteroidales bacterium]|nr:RNA polymerase sigma-70 factor [Bacteroidales bacterium]MDD2424438.1 RNA polymerase sigma-70 factor [Bacteroidales bacterium]MDD4638287.1 RNA polymerase sigma-70 factor [Bacteroidales bacterium]
MKEADHSESQLIVHFENAFRLYFHKIHFIAGHYLKNKEQAENVAQDVFTTLWEKRYEVDFSRPIFPYLTVLTKNRCFNILKNKKIQHKFRDKIQKESIQLKIDLLNSSSEEILFAKEREKLVMDSMDRMSDKIREAFLLSRFENKKYEEVAEIQQVSVKTIEYRIMSALKILRKDFKDFFTFF